MVSQSGILESAEVSLARAALSVTLMLCLLVLSAWLSGSEAVLFSLTPVQLERAAASSSRFRRLAARLMRQSRRTLMTILVANTAVNTLLFSISYVFFRSLAARAGPWVTPVAGIGTVLLVIVGGEVVPKVLAVRMTDRLLPLGAVAVRAAGLVAGPIGKVLDWLVVEPLTRIIFGKPRPRGGGGELSDLELKALLEMSRRGGTIRPAEDAFLRAVIDLAHLRVRDVMVPRVEMSAYDVNGPADGLRQLMRTTRHKKVPVYDRNLDNIVGLVYAKVLFLNPGKPLRALVQPVRFVPDLINCEQLLVHFRSTRSQLAIAVDEYGGVAGLVTLEDVLEQIVGELHDPEETPVEPDLLALPNGHYDISGQLNVHYWVKVFDLPPRLERVATVGGLVMTQLGRPARVGDVVRLGNVELQVTRLRHRRIDRLRLRLLDQRPAGSEGA